jgi:hypothetical protein
LAARERERRSDLIVEPPWLTRRAEGATRWYVTDEQRRQPEWIGGDNDRTHQFAGR